MSDYLSFLNSELNKIGIDLPESILQKLIEYIDILLRVNKVINLTAITDIHEALIKHIYDSLVVLNFPEYTKAESILDIGSGAGIPGIPLAISSPEKKFISLDATQKKIKFQEDVCNSLLLNNLQPIWSRAEDYIKQNGVRENFDLILSRAVAPINTLAELTIPYCKIKGRAIFYKGKDYQDELNEGEKAIFILGGKVERVKLFDLPKDYGTRALISIIKEKSTSNQYPRKAGTPSKNPLK